MSTDTAHPMRVVIIEDEAEIRRFLRVSLEAHGFHVTEARLGAQGLAACAAQRPALVMLDLGLPDMDGIELVRRLREWSSTPILVLSVRSHESQKVTALDAGANDYVTKPFGIAELMARVRALLRTAPGGGAQDSSTLEVGGLVVDLLSHRVSVDSREVAITPKEFALIALLARNPGRVLTHTHILMHVWGSGHDEDVHYLRVLVRNLRRKLDEGPDSPRFVHTVAGVGYRLEDLREHDIDC